MARFSGLEIEPYIVLEGRILSNAFASRDFLVTERWPDDSCSLASIRLAGVAGLQFQNHPPDAMRLAALDDLQGRRPVKGRIRLLQPVADGGAANQFLHRSGDALRVMVAGAHIVSVWQKWPFHQGHF